jgi:hypothetical protein
VGRRPRSGPPAVKSDEAEGTAFGFERGKRVKGIEACGPQTLAALWAAARGAGHPRSKATKPKARPSASSEASG